MSKHWSGWTRGRRWEKAVDGWMDKYRCRLEGEGIRRWMGGWTCTGVDEKDMGEGAGWVEGQVQGWTGRIWEKVVGG